MNSSKKDLEWFGKEFNTFSESYMKKIGDDLDEATKITYKDFSNTYLELELLEYLLIIYLQFVDR